MEITTFCKCACATCGEVIEYLAEKGGQVVVCPKCKEKSVLPEPKKLVVMEKHGPATPEFKTCFACGSQMQFWSRVCPACEAARQRRIFRNRILLCVGVVVLLAVVLFALQYHSQVAEARAKVAAVTIPSGSRILFEQPRPRQPKSTNDLHPGSFILERRRGSDLVLAVGDIVNNSENVHLRLRADLDLLDKTGAKIGSISDYATQLGPHQSWHFLATVTETNAYSVRFAGLKEDQ